jgi:flagellar export protein FliJ
MRRFRFRLSPLLRLRSQHERIARRELAAATSAISAIDQKLAAAAQGLADCGAQAPASGPVGRLARALETGLRRHQWRLQTQQRLAQQRLDAVRAEYVQRARDLKTLKNLRDKRREEWLLEARKVEQAELEELGQAGRTRLANERNEDGEP